MRPLSHEEPGTESSRIGWWLGAAALAWRRQFVPQWVDRLFVFFDPREAPELFHEVVVGMVVIDLADFPGENRSVALLAVKAVVDTAIDGDTLSRHQSQGLTRLQADHLSVSTNRNRFFAVGGTNKLDHQVAAGTIDDVFELDPVEMEGRFLSFLDHEHLFRIRPLVNGALDAIAQAKQHKATLSEIAGAEICYVPTHLPLKQELGKLGILAIVLQRPV